MSTLMTQLGAEVASRIQAAQTAAVASANSYTDAAIAGLVNSAPATLDTLNEIATAIQNNADAISAIQNAAVASHTHDNATTTTAGFMSAADKTKLDNLGTYAEFVSAFETAYGSNSDSNS